MNRWRHHNEDITVIIITTIIITIIIIIIIIINHLFHFSSSIVHGSQMFMNSLKPDSRDIS